MKFEQFAKATIPAFLLFMLFLAQATNAAPPKDELAVGQCIRKAARGSLWLEKTLWGLHDQEAGWIGAEVLNTNGSHDLGVLQINSSWVPSVAQSVGRPRDQVRHWLKFDPCFNAETARWLFLTALNQTHDFWKAVGVYHSPTIWRQKQYALSVARHLRRRFGDEMFKSRNTVLSSRTPVAMSVRSFRD